MQLENSFNSSEIIGLANLKMQLLLVYDFNRKFGKISMRNSTISVPQTSSPMQAVKTVLFQWVARGPDEIIPI